ncbi:MAG: hypothetical protein DPW09_07865 [Anaerolineae bacterium]|nr:hypothetical protein [Anaerolineales bacterium]MCQ3973343.1 hypothetical protein [Anaerolineae bacterium]
MAEETFQLYFDVLQTLEKIGAPYVIIGAFAGTFYGVTRVTLDVDIVVDLNEKHIQALAATYLPPRFYTDSDQMRDSIRLGILFNIIDTSEARKVDLIPLTMKPGYHFALKNRLRREIATKGGVRFEAWFARPEDVIVGKLMAWKEGRSFKHESDIRDILTAIKLEDDPELSASFDPAYIDHWASQLGHDVEQFWQNLQDIINLEN